MAKIFLLTCFVVILSPRVTFAVGEGARFGSLMFVVSGLSSAFTYVAGEVSGRFWGPVVNPVVGHGVSGVMAYYHEWVARETVGRVLTIGANLFILYEACQYIRRRAGSRVHQVMAGGAMVLSTGALVNMALCGAGHASVGRPWLTLAYFLE